jgi:hypothetical protein
VLTYHKLGTGLVGSFRHRVRVQKIFWAISACLRDLIKHNHVAWVPHDMISTYDNGRKPSDFLVGYGAHHPKL